MLADRYAPSQIVATTTMVVFHHERPPGPGGPGHRHRRPELVWSPDGRYIMGAGGPVWDISPAVALWIPGGVHHRVVRRNRMHLFVIHHSPEMCPIRWSEPTLVSVTALVRSLLEHLGEDDLDPLERARAEEVLYDNLRPVERSGSGLRLPNDLRARRVAEALLHDPGDNRPIEGWADQVHSSRRTLSRLFREETSMTFTDWRTTARMHAALAMLGGQTTVSQIARQVGYRNVNSFSESFHRLFGLTPTEFIERRRV